MNIDDELISFAHAYSQPYGVSIFRLFEQYLARLRTSEQNQELNPQTTNLQGIFQDVPVPDKKTIKASLS